MEIKVIAKQSKAKRFFPFKFKTLESILSCVALQNY